MKINPLILFLVIAAGVYIGINLNEPITDTKADTAEQEQANAIFENIDNEVEEENVKTNGLTVDYLREYLVDAGFSFKGPQVLKSTYLYTGEYKVADSSAAIVFQIYQEQSNDVISLIEFMVEWQSADFIGNSEREIQIEQFLTDLAMKSLPQLAKVPYDTSQPEAASKWVSDHIEQAYSEEPSEDHNFRKEFGNGSYHLYGGPYFRVFEINLGF
jgi:hypothetical protein